MKHLSKALILICLGLIPGLTCAQSELYLDDAFSTASQFSNYIYDVVEQPDGKVIVVGGVGMEEESDTPFPGIMRLNADGTVDPTFNSGTGADGTILAVALQSDGKIVIGGEFVTYNGVSRARIARLNADGSLDNTFNPGQGASNAIHNVVVQPDGKILIGGDFTSYNGVTRYRVARVNSDGSNDNTFLVSSNAANNAVRAIALQPDGKVLVGGSFTAFDGTGYSRLVRLHSNGSIDATFNTLSINGVNDGNVRDILVMDNGQVMVTGQFTSFNNNFAYKCVVRLNSDGTPDNTFDVGSSFTGGPAPGGFRLAQLPDDRVVIGGVFETYQGNSSSNVIVVNSDGSINATNPYSFAQVLSVAVSQNGSILAGGHFQSAGGTDVGYMVRFAPVSESGTIPTNGLLAKYSFNQGNAVDEIGSNDGVVSGATLTEDRFGNAGHAYEFDGVNDMIDFGDAPEFRMGTNDFAISFWLYYDEPQVAQVIGKRSVDLFFEQYAVFIGDGNIGSISTGQNVTALTRTGGVNRVMQGGALMGSWKHIVLNHSHGGATRIFVDGQEAGSSSTALAGNLDAVGRPFQVGFFEQGPGEYFKGKVDDIFVYGRTLDQVEILSLYNDPAPSECIVNIPDANFKAALVGNNAINTNQDVEIQCDEAAAFSGTLNLSNLNIADLTGIEAFTSLTQLFCTNNTLTSVDVSANTALTLLSLNNNSLTSLDVSNNTALTSLTCNNNQLASLDVSNNNQLTALWLADNQLTSLDLSNNPALSQLLCVSNSLNALDLSNNSNLTSLVCGWNPITSLQLGNLTSLSNLEVYGTGLSQIDLSQNPAIATIYCNNISSLQTLNLVNGNNGIITRLHAQSNPLLECIEVDDAAFSTANWTGSNFPIDPQTSFSENCLTVGIDESPTLGTGVFPNPTSGILNLTQPASGQVLDLSGRSLLTFSNTRSIDLSGLASGSYVVRTTEGAVMRVMRE